MQQLQSSYYWNKTLRPVFSDQDCPVSKTGQTVNMFLIPACNGSEDQVSDWKKKLSADSLFSDTCCLSCTFVHLEFQLFSSRFGPIFPSLGLVRTVKVTFYYFLTLYLSLPRHSKLLTYSFFKLNCALYHLYVTVSCPVWALNLNKCYEAKSSDFAGVRLSFSSYWIWPELFSLFPKWLSLYELDGAIFWPLAMWYNTEKN